MAFIGAMGVITHKVLAPGETLLIDTNSLVSWEDTVEFDARRPRGPRSVDVREPARGRGTVKGIRKRRAVGTRLGRGWDADGTGRGRAGQDDGRLLHVLLRGRGPLQHETDGPRGQRENHSQAIFFQS